MDSGEELVPLHRSRQSARAEEGHDMERLSRGRTRHRGPADLVALRSSIRYPALKLLWNEVQARESRACSRSSTISRYRENREAAYR